MDKSLRCMQSLRNGKVPCYAPVSFPVCPGCKLQNVQRVSLLECSEAIKKIAKFQVTLFTNGPPCHVEKSIKLMPCD